MTHAQFEPDASPDEPVGGTPDEPVGGTPDEPVGGTPADPGDDLSPSPDETVAAGGRADGRAGGGGADGRAGGGGADGRAGGGGDADAAGGGGDADAAGTGDAAPGHAAGEAPGSGPGADRESAGVDLSGLEQLLGDDFARIAAERDEYLASLQRLQADFDNYRKRAMRQQTELLDRAAEGVLTSLLPVLDALDLALAHLGGAGDDCDTTQSAASLAQVASLLRDTLGRDGLSRIDDVGVPFDPTVHDAVAHETGDDGAATPEVVEIMRPGYQLNGKVIRPAMVKVLG